LLSPTLGAAEPAPAYPLEVSANHRYLVDRNNHPFLIVGDSPQTPMGRVSMTDWEFYVANRQGYGINALWVHVMCRDNEFCNKDGSTPDGIVPFLTEGDLATPNPAYFARLDKLLGIAAAHGMVVLLTPVETSGWLGILKSNGPDKAFAFGQYLGQRYRDVPNIIWMHGNDFQTWKDPADDAVVLAVARGIRSEDRNHLHTIELNYLDSGSMDDPNWRGMIDLDAAYTYSPTYERVLHEYDRKDFKPEFLVEATYEFEHDSRPSTLRRQEYWAMLSGAAGQLYGSGVTWTWPRGWRLMLDTPGVAQLSQMKSLFAGLDWQDLVPDQNHAIVTVGAGDPAPLRTGSVRSDFYATTAATPDGRLAMSYLPSAREIAVDMSRLAGPVRARWYDPTDGRFSEIEGSPLPNSGTARFHPPGKNRDGDEDWVLVLEAK
jgi:hypothetical protein